MNYSTELKKFIRDNTINNRGLDLSGDSQRFFKLKTARAWTEWLEKAGK